MGNATIWKFVIEDPETPVPMPYDARVLSVGVQRGKVCVWALVDPDMPKVLHPFVIVPTGEQMPDHGRFLGTVMLRGFLVFHVFDGFGL